jgi:hypothetical protein
VPATLAEVAQWAMALPEVTVGERFGRRTWFVGKKAFAWDRPFSKADIKRFGEAAPPTGPIVAVTTEDLAEKESVLAEGAKGVFTIEHFNGYPAVLVQLDVVHKRTMQRLLVDGWLAVAPSDLAESYLASKAR